jgi:hypothetical protein
VPNRVPGIKYGHLPGVVLSSCERRLLALTALTSIHRHLTHRTPDRNASKLSHLLEWHSTRFTLHQLQTSSQSSILAKYRESCPSFPRIGILYLDSTPEISCNIRLFEGIDIQQLTTSILSNRNMAKVYPISICHQVDLSHLESIRIQQRSCRLPVIKSPWRTSPHPRGSWE